MKAETELYECGICQKRTSDPNEIIFFECCNSYLCVDCVQTANPQLNLKNAIEQLREEYRTKRSLIQKIKNRIGSIKRD